MCGIAGIVSLGSEAIDPGLLKMMTDALAFRGPEEEGFHIDANVGFGHRRLKIIDLSRQAIQPMFNERKDIVLTYNGEIYNYLELRKELIEKGHRFISHGDAEVIIHAYEEWGFDLLLKLRGMWAFALWDSGKKRLFIARDRFGIKPLYYFFDTGKFIFASEIKAILEDKTILRQAEKSSILEYIYLGYSLGSKTWFKKIFKLEPGHYLTLDSGGLFIKDYWKPVAQADYSISEDDAKAALRGHLERSVKLMLQSDVEVGAHLSGGIDSSSVAILANRISPRPVKTFSGTFNEGEDFDESKYIDLVAASSVIDNKKVTVSSADFMDNLAKIVWHLDEPTAGPAAYPQYFVSRLVNSSGLKVVLGGQGADELFFGYPHYYGGIPASISRLRRMGGLNSYQKYLMPAVLRNKCFIPDLRRRISRFISTRAIKTKKILSREFYNMRDLERIKEDTGFYKKNVEELSLWDISNYLPSLLQVEDRLSMAFSVETRLPFLHEDLVDFSLRLPFYMKINSFNFKYILRKAVRDLLPENIYNRVDKKGFPTPAGIWLKNPNISREASAQIKAFTGNLFNDSEPSWEKINIALWLKIYKVSL